MNSGGHRGFTVVTIVTLVFASVFAKHHWMWRLVNVTHETQIVQCAPKHPCPKRQTIVKVVRVGQPTEPPRGSHQSDTNDPSAVDNPDTVASQFAGGDGFHR